MQIQFTRIFLFPRCRARRKQLKATANKISPETPKSLPRESTNLKERPPIGPVSWEIRHLRGSNRQTNSGNNLTLRSLSSLRRPSYIYNYVTINDALSNNYLTVCGRYTLTCACSQFTSTESTILVVLF